MILADIPWEVLLSPFGIPVVAIVCVFVWLIVASIAEEVGKVMRNKNDTELKLELLSRGLTAEEVARIVAAGREGDDETPRKSAREAVFG